MLFPLTKTFAKALRLVKVLCTHARNLALVLHTAGAVAKLEATAASSFTAATAETWARSLVVAGFTATFNFPPLRRWCVIIVF